MNENPFGELAKLRATFTADTRTGLIKVAEGWSKLAIDGTPQPAGLEGLRQQYTESMLELIDLPGDERIGLLRDYSYAMRLREGRTTQSQRSYLRKMLDPERIGPPVTGKVVEFLDAIVEPGASLFTSEFILYTASHMDLGVYLPESNSTEVFRNIREYLVDVKNQKPLLDPEGHLNLEAIIQAHYRFLSPPDSNQNQAEDTLSQQGIFIQKAPKKSEDA